MDSITQAALGGIVGRSLSKRTGITPLIAGAVAGTMPDWDVIVFPFISDISSLVSHRSLTHSLLLCLPAAWLFSRFLKNWRLEKKEWFGIFFWCFVTHILLDLCTTYGTQIFWPLSRYPFALSSIFIIDLFYTLPLLVGFFYYLRSKAKEVNRNFAFGVLIFTTSYLLLGGALKIWAQTEFKKSLQQQGIEPQFFTTKTAPFTIFQWTAISVDKRGDRYGWFSIFHPQRKIQWQFTPRLEDTEKIEKLLMVKKDFFATKKILQGLLPY